MSEPFPHPPLESIALHRGTRFATDGDPEPASGHCGDPVADLPIGPRLAGHDDELGRRASPAAPKHAGEVSRIEKSVARPESPGPGIGDGVDCVRGVDPDCRSARPLQVALHAYFDEMLTARRLRPLARRALKTARPPLVFIRSRNPWVRRRLIRLGWNVRFMTADPHSFILRAGGSRRTRAGVFRAPGPWVGRAGRPGFLRPRPEFVDSSLGSAGAYPAGSRRVNARPALIRPDPLGSMRRATAPDPGLACYSRDRNRGFVVPALSACRRGALRTSGGQIQNLCPDADMPRFCPSLCHSLLLLFHFNPPIRRAG